MRPQRTLLISSPLLMLMLAAAAPARAQTAPPPVASTQPSMTSVIEHPGFDLGLRLGYAVPMGDAAQGATLSDGISGLLPFVLEAGYRFTPNVTAGALFQYAPLMAKNCPAGESCSGSVVRLGIQGIYNFRMPAVLDPWVGVGLGYEWLNLSETGQPDVTLSGFEFLNLQGGADYRVAPQFALGPFISLSIARYGSASSGGASADIQQTATHEWLQLGVRGTFSL